jgi:hypothetical protein
MQDNNDMTYHRSAVVAPMYNAIANSLNSDVLPTDINLQTEQSSYDANTDVVYFDRRGRLRRRC